jgi:exosortase/archaeosortase family protein
MKGKDITNYSKRTFVKVLILLVLILLILPFWASFQDFLTQLIMKIELYKSLQNVIVPYELKVTGTILSIVGIPIRVGNAYIEWTKAGGGNEVIYLAWNCVGWQTLVLFVITLMTGLSGNHTITSKGETLVIGILGTYLINILRLVLVVFVYFVVGRPIGIVFHDYFSNLLTIAWLFFYWYFSYSFVLESKVEARLSNK